MEENCLHVIDPHQPKPRPAADVLAMTVVTQANLAQLRTAEAKRRKIEPAAHEIRVPPPGPVRAHREALIDYHMIQRYSDGEVHLRLHEIWGQFCLLCWSLDLGDPHKAPPLAALSPSMQLHCASALELKAAEIEGYLWRLKFEQRLRHEPEFRRSPMFDSMYALAKKIPVMVSGKPVGACDAHALMTASCEHAGMLAAIRWIGDERRVWGEEGIMDVSEEWRMANSE